METKRKSGFTIVELLTVMAIIAILMGLLLPAMQAVRKLAKDTSQRAEFKTIEVALDGYHNENGMYPESSVSTSGTPYTVGAQKFTEALVGRDMLGFDTKSTWDARYDETRSDAEDVYSSLDISGTVQAQVDASLKRRQPTYLNIDNVEAFQVKQLFEDTKTVYPGNFKNDGTPNTGRIAAPIMTDVYKAKRVTLPSGESEMAGTPILYYKANLSSTKFPDTADYTGNVSTDNLGSGTYAATVSDANQQGYIYNIFDNDDLIQLWQMTKPTNTNLHHFDENYSEDVTYGSGTVTTANVNGVWLFYNAITNPKMTSQVRPYNTSSYILISAGHDGIYGTKDDICNFEK